MIADVIIHEFINDYSLDTVWTVTVAAYWPGSHVKVATVYDAESAEDIAAQTVKALSAVNVPSTIERQTTRVGE